MTNSPTRTLQDKIDAHGDVWSMLYNAHGQKFAFPVQAEFTNWIDEQTAWRRSAIFQNMSHHMTDVYFEGPDVVRLLSDFGVNSFSDFGPMQAKQYVACNPDGHYMATPFCFAKKKTRSASWASPWLRTGSASRSKSATTTFGPTTSTARLQS